MVFFDKEIIVFLDDHIFPANKFGCFEFFKEIIIEIGTLFDQFEFGGIAMCHSTIKLSLKQESDQKPVDAYDTIVGALNKKNNDGHNDGERGLEYHVHVLKQVENQFQVYILQLD